MTRAASADIITDGSARQADRMHRSEGFDVFRTVVRTENADCVRWAQPHLPCVELGAEVVDRWDEPR